MDIQKKLTMLEEIMELDKGALKAEMALSDMDEWDSMAKLSLVVLFDDEFGKKMSGEQIRSFVTVQDILNLMD